MQTKETFFKRAIKRDIEILAVDQKIQYAFKASTSPARSQ